MKAHLLPFKLSFTVNLIFYGESDYRLGNKNGNRPAIKVDGKFHCSLARD